MGTDFAPGWETEIHYQFGTVKEEAVGAVSQGPRLVPVQGFLLEIHPLTTLHHKTQTQVMKNVFI